MIITIIASFVLWIVVEWMYPGFFDPWKYWLLTDNIPAAVLKSWPLFAYAAIVSTIALFLQPKNSASFIDDTATFIGDVYKSVMAGILEEIGFRCFFIFTAMVSIAVLNWILQGAILWLYGHLIIPVLHYISFGLFDPVIYTAPLLFAAGMISANFEFKDGHKYQGPFGMLNAWLIGFYLLFVMLTQGLLIAILVHMIYDLIIGVIKYIRHA